MSGTIKDNFRFAGFLHQCDEVVWLLLELHKKKHLSLISCLLIIYTKIEHLSTLPTLFIMMQNNNPMHLSSIGLFYTVCNSQNLH